MKIERENYRRQIADSLARFRVTALLGPRQCGKTTLARAFATGPDAYFDLEDPLDLARLEAPRQTLGALTGLVVIDEIQRRPDLFPLLRVLADRPDQIEKMLSRPLAQTIRFCWYISHREKTPENIELVLPDLALAIRRAMTLAMKRKARLLER